MIVARLGAQDDEKFLLSNGFINLVCPTRWWAKLKEYSRLVKNTEQVDRLLSIPTIGPAVYNRVREYLHLTRRPHVISRLLEKDTSNAVVAIWGLMYLCNSDEPIVALSVMNRWLKFYATNEVPLLAAVLCDGVLAGCGELLQDTRFTDALTEVIFPLLHAGRVTLDTSSLWADFLAAPPVDRPNALPTFKEHHTPGSKHAFRQAASRVHHIQASESSAERVISRMSIIYNQRFKLSPAQCKAELMLAFNPLPSAPVQADSPQPVVPAPDRHSGVYPNVQYVTPDESADEASVPLPQTHRRRTEDPNATAGDSEANWDADTLAKTADTIGPISARDGQQIIMLWWWRTSQWDTFQKGDEVRYLKDPSARNLSSLSDAIILGVSRMSYVITYADAIASRIIFGRITGSVIKSMATAGTLL